MSFVIAYPVFWIGFKSGWLAILVYHAQAVLWVRGDIPELGFAGRVRHVLASSTLLAGPLLYFALPHVSRLPLVTWLSEYGLTGWSLVLMIPYFGIVHPLIEQVHWAPLRKRTKASHVIFAGYHVLVLYSLLDGPWLILCFLLLCVASVAWESMARKARGLAVPIVSHIGADLGIVTAAWLRSVGG